MKLAREIGAYHYTYSSLEELQRMDLREALQHLFLQPVNAVMEHEYKVSKVTLKVMYNLKRANPNLLLMNAL